MQRTHSTVQLNLPTIMENAEKDFLSNKSVVTITGNGCDGKNRYTSILTITKKCNSCLQVYT